MSDLVTAAAAGAGSTGGARAETALRYAALGHAFSVESDDPELAGLLEHVLASLIEGTQRDVPAVRYRLLTRGSTLRLLADDVQLTRADAPWFVLGYLMWHINRQAVSRSPDLVRVHAAAAVRDGAGILFPAAMEAGKTTLVAGLIRSGYSYLSDEIAAIDPVSGEVRAYPKPLSIDPGSWEVLADLRPALSARLQPYFERQWQVSPLAVRPGSVVQSASPRAVVAPRYVAGARTHLQPVSKAELLELLATQTFGFRVDPSRDLPVLGHLLARCACFRLTVGDLDSALDTIGNLMGDLA